MVFRLLPDLAVFNYGGLNQMVAHIEKSIIIIGGGGEGPALSIDA